MVNKLFHDYSNNKYRREKLTFSEGNDDVHVDNVDAVIGLVELERNHFAPHAERKLEDGALVDQRNLAADAVRQEPPPHRTIGVLLEPDALVVFVGRRSLVDAVVERRHADRPTTSSTSGRTRRRRT